MVSITTDIWLQSLQAIVPCRTISVMQIDHGMQTLDIVAFNGFLDAPHLSLPVGVGIAGAVADSGETECVRNVTDDPRFLEMEMELEALLCIPIISRDGEVLGVVNLSDPHGPNGFGPDEINEAEFFVRQNPFPF